MRFVNERENKVKQKLKKSGIIIIIIDRKAMRVFVCISVWKKKKKWQVRNLERGRSRLTEKVTVTHK